MNMRHSLLLYTQLPHDKYEYLCQVDSLVYNEAC